MVQSGSYSSRYKHGVLTRQASEGTELAELLAEHQERQLRSMQGLNVGMHRKWGSSSRINELHTQTNLTHQSLNANGLARHLEQIPLNNGAMMTVHAGYGVSSQGNQQVLHSGKNRECLLFLCCSLVYFCSYLSKFSSEVLLFYIILTNSQ